MSLFNISINNFIIHVKRTGRKFGAKKNLHIDFIINNQQNNALKTILSDIHIKKQTEYL